MNQRPDEGAYLSIMCSWGSEVLPLPAAWVRSLGHQGLDKQAWHDVVNQSLAAAAGIVVRSEGYSHGIVPAHSSEHLRALTFAKDGLLAVQGQPGETSDREVSASDSCSRLRKCPRR
jgi:hypothetical protein